jgi:DNA-binding MarR family transcriptional regulator
MSTPNHFNKVLRDWAEMFMRRSMHDFVQFSKVSGLSIVQLNTLFRLYHAGRCGVSEIGDHLGVTNAAASQMVERLVQMGFMERTEDPNDRRAKQLHLTPKGQQLILESIEARRHWMEDLTQALSPQEQEAIIQALVTLTAAAHQLEKEKKENNIAKPQNVRP